MAILLYFIMLLYFVSYYLYSNVYGFTLFVSYIMLSHHWLGYISQILVFKPNILYYIIITNVIHHITPDPHPFTHQVWGSVKLLEKRCQPLQQPVQRSYPIIDFTSCIFALLYQYSHYVAYCNMYILA